MSTCTVSYKLMAVYVYVNEIMCTNYSLNDIDAPTERARARVTDLH